MKKESTYIYVLWEHKTVCKYGDVYLSEFFILKDVLYVLSFKCNLLSVGKILK